MTRLGRERDLLFAPLEPMMDPFAAAGIDDPYAVFAEPRERDPVHWSDELDAWVLTRHSDVKAALHNPKLPSRVLVASASEVRWATLDRPVRHFGPAPGDVAVMVHVEFPPPRRESRHPAVRRRWAALGATAVLVTACSNSPTTGPDATVPPAAAAAPTSAGTVPMAASETSETMPPPIASRLDAAISATMANSRIPGATIGVWSPQGTYLKSFGVADRRTDQPMDSALMMRIGSETKTFTVTALLQLVDHGRLQLDDPIGNYLPGVPSGDKVTIRDLAGMRSGLPTYLSNPSFAKAFLADPSRQYTSQELLDYAFTQPSLSAPGTTFNYSNTNTILLGKLVEQLSGQSLAANLQANVFGPLKLAATSYPKDAAIPGPHAHGYTKQTSDGQETDATDWNPSIAGAAGAMISDARDLGVWARVLVQGDLLTPATQAQRLQFLPESPDDPDVTYGLGIYRNHGWTGHDGGIPGYQSLTLYLPQAKTALVILLNTDTPVSVNNGVATQTPSNLMCTAITAVLSPDHVYSVPAAHLPQSSKPTASSSSTSG